MFFFFIFNTIIAPGLRFVEQWSRHLKSCHEPQQWSPPIAVRKHSNIFEATKNPVQSIVCSLSLPQTDNRLTINKELPTTKWRRDRRIRLSSEYHSDNSVAVKPLGESNSGTLNENANMETPLDMTTTVSKIAAPPPPPYREPLPGSNFSRPSVITQAPKREISPGNQENKESFKKATIAANQTDNSTTTGTLSSFSTNFCFIGFAS